jgi:hypothetical protein
MESKIGKAKVVGLIVAVVIVYLLVFTGSGLFILYVFKSERFQLENTWSLGDVFAAISALFTGLAFVAVAFTIYSQMKDSKANKWFTYVSQIENTFFNMLSILQQIINFARKDVPSDKGTEVKSGRDYFRFAFSNLMAELDKNVRPKADNLWGTWYSKLNDRGLDLEELEKAMRSYEPDLKKILPWFEGTYEGFYNGHRPILGHYFRYVYNLFKYIIESFPNDRKLREKYISLIQAQMSDDELGLLFYNALSVYGRNKEGKEQFREWLDDYNFFENMDERCLFIHGIEKAYPKTKFKFKTAQVSQAE